MYLPAFCLLICAGPLEKRKFVQAGLEQGWVDPLAFARRFNCTNREECQAAMTRIVNAVVGSITMESPKTSFIRRTAAAFIAYDWDNVEMQTYWNRRKDIAQIKADVSEQHTIISRQLTEELEPVPKAKRQQQLNTDSSTCTPPPKRRQTLPMDMSYKMHLPALYTPQPTEKLSTSISDDETISGAHLARLRACQDEAPTPVIIAGLDLADKLRVFQRSILRSRTEITQYDTEHFLGAHSCLLISEARPDEYCELFSHEDWCAIREYFEERYLESTKQDGYVERMLGEMYTRKKAVKSWFPTVDQDNEQECRHASSLLRM
ncbi:hypothetical protein BC832DRAFT_402670 [Gaertneriomyces semiglobifer]|nr:hypothetical protein BC832DRAFT_402670 [Gaertneriomyces semiglobifer]